MVPQRRGLVVGEGERGAVADGNLSWIGHEHDGRRRRGGVELFDQGLERGLGFGEVGASEAGALHTDWGSLQLTAVAL